MTSFNPITPQMSVIPQQYSLPGSGFSTDPGTTFSGDSSVLTSGSPPPSTYNSDSIPDPLAGETTESAAALLKAAQADGYQALPDTPGSAETPTDGVKDLAEDAGMFAAEPLAPVVGTAAVGAASSVAPTLTSSVVSAAGGISDAVGAGLSAAGEAVGSAATAAGSAIAGGVTAAAGAIGGEAAAGAATAAIGAVGGAVEGALACAGPVGWAVAGIVGFAMILPDFIKLFKHKDFQKDVQNATKQHETDIDSLDKDGGKVGDDQSKVAQDAQNGDSNAVDKDNKNLKKDQKSQANDQKHVRGDNQRAYVDANKIEDGIRKQSVNVQKDKDALVKDKGNDKKEKSDQKQLDKDNGNLKDQETTALSKAGKDPNAQQLTQNAINAGEMDVQIDHNNGQGDWAKHTQNNFYVNETHGHGDKSGNLDPYSASLSDLAANSTTLTHDAPVGDSGGTPADGSEEAADDIIAQDHPEDLASTIPDGLASQEGVADDDAPVTGGPQNSYEAGLLQAYQSSTSASTSSSSSTSSGSSS